MTSSYIILDTNVLLHDPRAIFRFPGENIILPIEVIEEVERFKRDPGELGNSCRTLTSLLEDLRDKGHWSQGIPLENKGTLFVNYNPNRSTTSNQGRNKEGNAEKSILSLAQKIQGEGNNVKIITQNINLRLKADVLNISAENFQGDHVIDSRKINGWRSLTVNEQALQQLTSQNKITLQELNGYQNEFIHLHTEKTPSKEALATVTSNPNVIQQLPPLPQTITGVSPLSLEQEFALQALIDDSINLVTLVGKAGTGKTLLAIAAALHKMYVENLYTKVLIFRPTMPVSRDMGFLPGDLHDKMGPWMQPIFDAVDLLKVLDKSSPRRSLPPDILESGDLTIEPLTYIRGRSIPNQFIIIDEAQNLTPLEVKTVITRVGKNSKIILTGDPHQIDNPYLDSYTNGLSSLVNKFLGHPLYAHISLVKGERSLLAEAAANLL